MPTSRLQILEYLERLDSQYSAEEAKRRLLPLPDGAPTSPRVRPSMKATEKSVSKIWETVSGAQEMSGVVPDRIADPQSVADAAAYSANIENFAGTVKVPVGIIGPLRVRGLHANRDFYVPLATTEAALVASYARGAQVIEASGGAVAGLLSEGVTRAPVFRFPGLYEAGQFCFWVTENFEMLKQIAESTTRFGKLLEISPAVDGSHVYLVCRYTTGDASGQNMVTFATEKMCDVLIEQCPIRPICWYLEGNLSGDKKASALSFLTGRGRHATASVDIPKDVVTKYLHTEAAQMYDYWRLSAVGGVMSGSIGIHGHFANGLAALYIATGQDAACVAESSVGVTRMDLEDEALKVTVTLPNLMLGTVGGGTGLPSQSAALEVLGLQGTGNAASFAEVTAALCLAGEISIIGALAAGEFGSAHKSLARGRR